jgi:hypothetical protein
MMNGVAEEWLEYVAFDDTKLELLHHATPAVQYHYYGDWNGNDTTRSDANVTLTAKLGRIDGRFCNLHYPLITL